MELLGKGKRAREMNFREVAAQRIRDSTMFAGGMRYDLQKAINSTTSTRRSPDSHFETKDCGLRSRLAAWT